MALKKFLYLMNAPNKQFHIPLNAQSLTVILAIAAIVGWFVSYGKQQERIDQALSDIKTIQTGLDAVELWQIEWVEQNGRISSLEIWRNEHKFAGGVEHPIGVILQVRELAAKLEALKYIDPMLPFKKYQLQFKNYQLRPNDSGHE